MAFDPRILVAGARAASSLTQTGFMVGRAVKERREEKARAGKRRKGKRGGRGRGRGVDSTAIAPRRSVWIYVAGASAVLLLALGGIYYWRKQKRAERRQQARMQSDSPPLAS